MEMQKKEKAERKNKYIYIYIIKVRKKAKKSRETLCFSNVLRFRMVWVRSHLVGSHQKVHAAVA